MRRDYPRSWWLERGSHGPCNLSVALLMTKRERKEELWDGKKEATLFSNYFWRGDYEPSRLVRDKGGPLVRFLDFVHFSTQK